ncbi:hypothetical protein GGR57DRAFT_448684 [Xylariaceae sp. FL1272]|nr:hypothetical protein GGR57DRAFT_448684 [Xylariaceae sp. FL1272]
MPRPPRGRAAQARLAKAAKTTTAPAPAPEPPAGNASSDIYDVSDREKERTAARRASLQVAASRTTSAETMQQKRSVSKGLKERDAAMGRLQNMTSTSGSEDSEDVNEKSHHTFDSPQLGETATPRRRTNADLSGFDLDDDDFDHLNTTVDTVAHETAQPSAETSTWSASHFRRRPRAGSFLNRDDGPIRPPSRGVPNTPLFSSTLNLGVFKRRAREPSILSTAQKPRPQRPEPEGESENDDDNDLEDDMENDNGENAFDPEDESTPLRRSTRRSKAADLVEVPSSAKSRKRKSTGTHERRARSSPFEGDEEEIIRNSIEEPEASVSSELSLPDLPPSTPVRASMDPALMAPPMSSDSSDNEEEIWPPITAMPKTRARQTPHVDEDLSDMSSPPSLTHSPNYAESSSPPPARATRARAKKSTAPKPMPKLTTAQLTGLLPRRRKKTGNDDPFNINEDDSEHEVDISGLGADDDELEMNVRPSRRPASGVGTSQQANGKSRMNTRKETAAASSKNKRVSRTYSRLSDKENQDEENEEGQDGACENAIGEEDSQTLVERMGVELKNAVRKFQEVDKWELSYEEGVRSSSPLDA